MVTKPKTEYIMTTTIAFILALFFSTNIGSTTSTPATDNHAPEWTIDAAHSAVNFKIRHFFTPIPGTFESWGGMLLFDPNNLEGSKIDISLEVGSINTKNERRDNHLRTDDFFNAEEFPTMKFVSTEIRSTGENAYVAVGELTIKETTKTIELPFKLLGVMADPRDENTTIAGFSAETKILRNEYGVGSGDYIQTAVIGDEVTIEINLEVRNTK